MSLRTLAIGSDADDVASVTSVSADQDKFVADTVRYETIAETFERRSQAFSRLRLELSIKRIVDVVASVVVLVAASPLLILTAIAVKATSPGPVLYAGERRGHFGRPFACFKFRSMIVDQQRALDMRGLPDRGADGRLFIYDSDPRLTPIGAVLRASSVDELPQLFNVLMGQMSLVGPRPLAPYMLEPYPTIGRARSVVKPGITGFWQTRRRMKNASVLDMIEDDMDYVAAFGIGCDLRIMLATIPRVLKPVRSSQMDERRSHDGTRAT